MNNIEKVLFDHLDELDEYLQDLEDLAEADQVRAEIAAGRSKTYSLPEVVKELGLED